MDVGLSQRKLAKMLGVDKKSVENWEGRGIAPARWMAPKLNELLGLQHPEKMVSFGERLTAYT
jgi:DNA-binding transcriptional regulator YiaG